MNGHIEMINVALPLIDEEKLFTVHIADGKWDSIIEQEQELHRSDYIPLTHQAMTTSTLLDAQKRIMLPGMVDAHMHLDKAFSLATVGNESGTLEEACDNYAAQVEQFSYEEYKQRILRAALQSIAYGTSHIRTHIDFHTQLGESIAMRGLLAALDVKALLAPYLNIQLILLVPTITNPEALRLVEKALHMGADGIGGAPFITADPQKEIELMFELSQKYGCILDFHSDESDDPEAKTVLEVANQAIARGLINNVTVGHLCSLASMPIQVAEAIITRIAEAQLGAISLPGANLYLQGRGDDERVRRGVTRIKSLLKQGVSVAVASDNINDPFHPFGRGDLVQIALLAGYSAHMGAPEDMRTLLKMITVAPAQIIKASEYGIAEGLPANLVIFDARTPEELFMLMPDRRWIYRSQAWLKAGGHPFEWSEPKLAEAWESLKL